MATMIPGTMGAPQTVTGVEAIGPSGRVGDSQIRALRGEAVRAGDLEQERLCDLALSGDASARAECARVIAAAAAQE